jgi:guanylate kinase
VSWNRNNDGGPSEVSPLHVLFRGRLLKNRSGDGILFALDGASGAGKTTLALGLVKAKPELTFVPRYTTRKSRHSESDAVEYLFVSEEQFSNMIDDGAFIEYRRYKFGMGYGLAWKDVEAVLEDGGSAVGIINLGNVAQLKKLCPEAVAILIDVFPETLQRRLINRGTNTPEQIAERLATARTVERFRELYDDVVRNEAGLDKALSDLSAIVDKWIAKRADPARRPRIS